MRTRHQYIANGNAVHADPQVAGCLAFVHAFLDSAAMTLAKMFLGESARLERVYTLAWVKSDDTEVLSLSWVCDMLHLSMSKERARLLAIYDEAERKRKEMEIRLHGSKKRCAACGKDRRRSSFHRQSTSIDGLREWCKDCERQRRERTAREMAGKRRRKKCAECGKKRARKYYYTNATTRDGLDPMCVTCRHKLNRENAEAA